MKILILHNRYKFAGGEEAVVDAEANLLRYQGHKVILFELSNEALENCSIFQKLLLPFRCLWSFSSFRKIRRIIKEEKPDVAHIHNTFFLMSPSVYYACRSRKIPVVQTLHNFRFICPLATLYRDGKICRECLGRGLMMSIKHKCGSKSWLWTLAMLSVINLHQKNKTFKRYIDKYIALSNFSRQQFIQAGYDGKKIEVKPNFINFDPGARKEVGNYALYVGRISPEKGLDVLLEAWKKTGHLELKIAGNGKELEEFRLYSKRNSLNINFLGQISNAEVFKLIKKSLAVIIPSRCNENFPRIVVETFACGVPLIASRSGALAEIIEDGKTGWLFDSGNSNDLAEKVNYADRERGAVKLLGENARKEFEAKYTVNKNYEILMSIYKETTENYRAKG